LNPQKLPAGVVEKCYAFEQIVTPKEMGQSIQADSKRCDVFITKSKNISQLKSAQRVAVFEETRTFND
jgi:hypothetical protein